MTSHWTSGAHLSKNGEGSVVPREEHRSWISSLLGKGMVLYEVNGTGYRYIERCEMTDGLLTHRAFTGRSADPGSRALCGRSALWRGRSSLQCSRLSHVRFGAALQQRAAFHHMPTVSGAAQGRHWGWPTGVVQAAPNAGLDCGCGPPPVAALASPTSRCQRGRLGVRTALHRCESLCPSCHGYDTVTHSSATSHRCRRNIVSSSLVPPREQTSCGSTGITKRCGRSEVLHLHANCAPTRLFFLRPTYLIVAIWAAYRHSNNLDRYSIPR